MMLTTDMRLLARLSERSCVNGEARVTIKAVPLSFFFMIRLRAGTQTNVHALLKHFCNFSYDDLPQILIDNCSLRKPDDKLLNMV